VTAQYLQSEEGVLLLEGGPLEGEVLLLDGDAPTIDGVLLEVLLALQGEVPIALTDGDGEVLRILRVAAAGTEEVPLQEEVLLGLDLQGEAPLPLLQGGVEAEIGQLESILPIGTEAKRLNSVVSLRVLYFD
jgi:hypothetical protein